MERDAMQKNLVMAASPKEIVWSNEAWKFQSKKCLIQRLIAARGKKKMAFGGHHRLEQEMASTRTLRPRNPSATKLAH
jgi:hypothetical protein